MKFELVYSIPERNSEGFVYKTRLGIKSGESFISIEADGDYSNRGNDELVNIALNKFYEVVFPNKAENEKFTELNETLSKANETITITRKAYSETIKSIATLEEKLYRLAEYNNFNLDDEEEDVVTD